MHFAANAGLSGGVKVKFSKFKSVNLVFSGKYKDIKRRKGFICGCLCLLQAYSLRYFQR